MDGNTKFRAFYTHQWFVLTLDEIKQKISGSGFVLPEYPTIDDIRKAYKIIFCEMSDPWEITANGDCTVELVQNPKPMQFELSSSQVQQLNEWKMKQEAKGDKNLDATGFRYTYTFSPCSLGMGVTVKDHITGEKLDLSDI
jgi:hypothetical protein